MRNTLVNWIATIVPWTLFFASSVLGHVALKRGAGTAADYDYLGATKVFFSFWGIMAMLSWGLSCWLWAVLLTKHTLFEANSVSAIRYGLLCLAAYFILKESVTARDIAGMTLIGAGVFLIAK